MNMEDILTNVSDLFVGNGLDVDILRAIPKSEIDFPSQNIYLIKD